VEEENLTLRISYKNGSYYMRADHSQFIDINEAPSAYYKSFPEEKLMLQPGDVFKIGSLTFAVERFNTNVVSEKGIRPSMEDTYLLIHDLGLDECLKISLYAVIDGHGGDQCAHYLRKHFENELLKNLSNYKTGILAAQTININQCISECITKSFINLDENFFKD
jgi:hypothetical protein